MHSSLCALVQYRLTLGSINYQKTTKNCFIYDSFLTNLAGHALQGWLLSCHCDWGRKCTGVAVQYRLTLGSVNCQKTQRGSFLIFIYNSPGMHYTNAISYYFGLWWGPQMHCVNFTHVQYRLPSAVDGLDNPKGQALQSTHRPHHWYRLLSGPSDLIKNLLVASLVSQYTNLRV